jgi:hypothetical protein
MKLYRLTATIATLIVLLIVVARLIGGAHGSLFTKLTTALWTNPDGSACEHPCMFGVHPYMTGYEESKGKLREHPFTREARETELVTEKTKSHKSQDFVKEDISIHVSWYTDYVTNTYLTFDYPPRERPNGGLHLPVPKFRLGDVIATLGTPDQSSYGPENIGNGQNVIAVYYEKYRLGFICQPTGNRRLNVDNPLVGIVVLGPTLRLMKTEWKGFTHYQRGLTFFP